MKRAILELFKVKISIKLKKNGNLESRIFC
jgi:hypothetical protein